MSDTIKKAMADGAAKLEQAGIEQARMEARVLAGFAIGGGPEKVLAEFEREMSTSEFEIFSHALRRRCNHEPMAHITQKREFWSLGFHVSPATLIPRPDSETIIEAVLDQYDDRDKKLKILDLGTGSGCLVLSLLSEFQNANGLGVDASDNALEIASKNASQLGLESQVSFINVDWRDAGWIKKLGGKFDVIISNPPYISDEEIKTLDPSVRDFEPMLALAGGIDGLDSYDILINAMGELLADDGLVAFEVGHKQARAVGALLLKKGLEVLEIREDLSGIERAVLARKIKSLN